MTRYLLTPSLLNAYKFFKISRKSDKREGFLKTLKKEFFSTPEIAEGIKFEDEVRDFTENKDGNYTDIQKEIGLIVSGGVWQDIAKKEISLNGNTFLLYGKCDVVKPSEIIYDIKTTKKYEKNKFKTSTQHKIYMFCKEIYNFEYLVCDWTRQEKAFKEKYKWEESMYNDLMEDIADFIRELNFDSEFLNVFKKKWVSF